MLVITGAAGKLGRHVIDRLISQGTTPDDIVATVRRPARAAWLTDRGVHIRYADYTDPDSLRAAFAGADRILLISSNADRQRAAQHRNVIEAAANANVDLLGYTSLLRADVSGIGLAVDHRATERMITESGVPAVILRNGWYIENYTENLATDLTTGIHLGSAGEGRVAGATRQDYAAAAAAVMTGDGHAGQVYELAGDTGFTMTDLAAEVTRASGKRVVYSDMTTSEHIKALVDTGVPEKTAELHADWDAGVARGDLDVAGPRLHDLIGHDTTRLHEAVAEALKNGACGQPGL